MKKVISQIKNLPKIFKIILIIGILVYLPLWLFTIYLNHINGVVLHEGAMPVLGSDSLEYKILAENILKNHFFSIDSIGPEYFRVPGYPFFIYILISLYNSYFFVTFIQVLLTLFTGFLVYKISSIFLSDSFSIICASLFLIEPSVVIHSVVLLSDMPFVFLLILFTYIVYFFYDSFYKYTLLGIILAVSVLFRPISMFLALLFPFFIFIDSKQDLKTKFLNITVFILIFIAVISPWIYRNKINSGKYFISTISSYNFFYYNIPMFFSWKNGITEDDVRSEIYKKNNLDEKSIKLPSNLEKLDSVNIDFIKKNLFGYGYFHLYKTTSFFFGSSIKVVTTIYKSIFNINTSYSLIEKSIFLLERLFWLFAFIASFFSILQKKNRKFFIYCFVLILYFAVLTGPVSYARYRLPVEPFVFILVMNFILQIESRFNIYK